MDLEQSAGTISSPSGTDKGKKPIEPSLDGERSIGHGENDILGGENVDAVLAAKMSLVNDVSLDPISVHGNAGQARSRSTRM